MMEIHHNNNTTTISTYTTNTATTNPAVLPRLVDVDGQGSQSPPLSAWYPLMHIEHRGPSRLGAQPPDRQCEACRHCRNSRDALLVRQ